MSAYVTNYEEGPSQKLKYSMILRYLQECAGRQMASEGMNYEMLRENGVVFLLTQAEVSIGSLPVGGETVTVETWVRGLRGAQYVRHMRMTGGRGVCAESESLWVAADPVRHRILRPSAFPFPELVRPFEGDRVAVHKPKIDLPGDDAAGWEVFSRPVRWSDIDCNGHMNNAVYADLICDCFPGGLKGRELSYFTITYAGEAREGEQMEIRSARSGGYAVFKGRVDGRRCFEAAAK